MRIIIVLSLIVAVAVPASAADNILYYFPRDQKNYRPRPQVQKPVAPVAPTVEQPALPVVEVPPPIQPLASGLPQPKPVDEVAPPVVTPFLPMIDEPVAAIPSEPEIPAEAPLPMLKPLLAPMPPQR